MKIVYLITNGVEWFLTFSVSMNFLSFAHLPLGLRVAPTCFCEICSLFYWWCWRIKLLLTTGPLHRHVAGVPFLCFKCGLYSQLFRNLWVVCVSLTSKSVWQKQKTLRQLFDMTDYTLHVSPGALVLCRQRLGLPGQVKELWKPLPFLRCFIFFVRMSSLLLIYFFMWLTRYSGSSESGNVFAPKQIWSGHCIFAYGSG